MSQLSLKKKRAPTLTGIFRENDVVLLVAEYLSDDELLIFRLVSKSIHNALQRSKIMEIRILKFRLHNAENYIDKMHSYIQRNGMKLNKRPKESNSSMSSLSTTTRHNLYTLGLPIKSRNSDKFNQLMSKIVLGAAARGPVQAKESPKKQRLPEPELFKQSDSRRGQKQVKLSEASDYSQKDKQRILSRLFNQSTVEYLNDRSFEYRIKKGKIKRQIQNYWENLKENETINKFQEDTNEILKETTKTMCPVVFAKKFYSSVQTAVTYLSFDYQMVKKYI